MKILKSKKFLMQIAALVLVAIVSVVSRQFDIGDDQTKFILGGIFSLTGLTIAAHTASDLTSMIKGIQKTEK